MNIVYVGRNLFAIFFKEYIFSLAIRISTTLRHFGEIKTISYSTHDETQLFKNSSSGIIFDYVAFPRQFERKFECLPYIILDQIIDISLTTAASLL